MEKIEIKKPLFFGVFFLLIAIFHAVNIFFPFYPILSYAKYNSKTFFPLQLLSKFNSFKTTWTEGVEKKYLFLTYLHLRCHPQHPLQALVWQMHRVSIMRKTNHQNLLTVGVFEMVFGVTATTATQNGTHFVTHVQ